MCFLCSVYMGDCEHHYVSGGYLKGGLKFRSLPQVRPGMTSSWPCHLCSINNRGALLWLTAVSICHIGCPEGRRRVHLLWAEQACFRNWLLQLLTILHLWKDRILLIWTSQISWSPAKCWNAMQIWKWLHKLLTLLNSAIIYCKRLKRTWRAG